MSGFVKVYGTIRTSSIWVEPPAIFKVWMTLLVEADPKGRVFGTVPGIANSAAVTVDECREAIAKFEAPDRDSRTPDDEGRRIRPIDGGWQLLNYKKYRELRTEKQIATAERVQRHRDRRREDQVEFRVTHVTGNAGNTRSQKSEVKESTTAADAAFEEFWKAYPKRAGGNPKGRARKAWNARIKNNHHLEAAIMDGLAKYRRFLEATGKLNTEYVMQAATFLGPDQHYLEAWTPPPPKGAPVNIPARPMATCPLCRERVEYTNWNGHFVQRHPRSEVPLFVTHADGQRGADAQR